MTDEAKNGAVVEEGACEGRSRDRLGIPFADLPVATRDWVLARAAADGVSPGRVLAVVLDAAAARDGFLDLDGAAA